MQPLRFEEIERVNEDEELSRLLKTIDEVNLSELLRTIEEAEMQLLKRFGLHDQTPETPN